MGLAGWAASRCWYSAPLELQFDLFFVVTLHYLGWRSTALTGLKASDLVWELPLDQLRVIKLVDKTLYAGDARPMYYVSFPRI